MPPVINAFLVLLPVLIIVQLYTQTATLMPARNPIAVALNITLKYSPSLRGVVQ